MPIKAANESHTVQRELGRAHTIPMQMSEANPIPGIKMNIIRTSESVINMMSLKYSFYTIQKSLEIS